jgi:hypothetical protein
MSSTGAAGALQIVLGGIAGSLLTWCLTWLRERRRLSDALRAPQREAIAAIVASAHELFIQEGRRTQLLIDRANVQEGKQRQFSQESFAGLAVELNRAILGLTMAMQIGQLTVIDPKCVSAANAVQEAFNQVKKLIRETSDDEVPDADSNRKLAADIGSAIDTLQKSVRDLVAVGRTQVSPTQGWWRRGSRGTSK